MNPVILIKTGGKVAVTGSELTDLIYEIKSLSSRFNFVLVHGGGAEVTAESRLHGLEAQFVDGKRMTTAQEMEVVDGILAGRVNKRLVRQFSAAGIKTVGLSGNDGMIFTGESIGEGNRTGRVTKCDPELIETLMFSGYTPVINSVSMDDEGESLNINADDAALEVSKSLNASKVIFISDIPGILKNNEVIPVMDDAEIKYEIEAGVISGGMIPKVNASLDAVKHGVESVVISNYNGYGDLELLINNQKGSLIKSEKGAENE